MGLLDWLLGEEESKKDRRKRIFISFAIEDIQYRDYLVKQARSDHSPFDFINMSVKKEWNQAEWTPMQNKNKKMRWSHCITE